jgi:hypothetical protein
LTEVQKAVVCSRSHRAVVVIVHMLMSRKRYMMHRIVQLAVDRRRSDVMKKKSRDGQLATRARGGQERSC